MTVVFRAGEDWVTDDGAPDGVRFDVSIPSVTKPDRPYRIVRQESGPGMSGYIVHTPACQAWRAGNRNCRHVLRALEWAEDPLRRFALDVIEAWAFKGFALDDFRDYSAAVYQSAQQAIDQADELDRYEERERMREAKARMPAAGRAHAHLSAVAEFDRGPKGAAR